jgi:hypothetical protein
MGADDDGPSLLVTYYEAGKILGVDQLDEAIATGRLRPIRLNDRPGAPSMFPRSLVERLRGGRRGA